MMVLSWSAIEIGLLVGVALIMIFRTMQSW